ncbi:MAG: hypothetical protein RLZZ628_4499, partial [Bacteroidota bacterium]
HELHEFARILSKKHFKFVQIRVIRG